MHEKDNSRRGIGRGRKISKMNILLICTHLNIGGIATYVVSTAKELKRRGYAVTVASSGGVMTGELTRNGIGHIMLNIRTKSELSPKLLFALPRLLSFMKNENVQLIHAHTRVTQVLAHIVSRITGIPYVATCHGFFKARLSRKLFKCWGDKTIAISDAVRQHLIEDFGVSTDDIELIYNGVELKRFDRLFTDEEKNLLRERLNLKNKKVVGAIGRLSPVKGFRYIIEAAKPLTEEYKDLQILIVGDGPEKAMLKGMCKRYNMEGRVTFADPDVDTPKLFSVMDIFVSTSVQEGLGLSLIESLASSKPVVATDVGGVSSLIKDNETGLLVRSRDSRELARAISALLKDPDLASRLGASGRKLTEDSFTLDVMVDKIEKAYKNAVAKGCSNKDRILIVNVNWLGDVLFTTPFIKSVRKRFPTSYIACMVVPRCKTILDDNPNLDEIIIYDEDGRHKSLLGKLKLIRFLKKRKFDAVFILHRSFTRALLLFLSGAKKRIAYDIKRRRMLLTKALKEPPVDTHKVEYFLNIAQLCGMDTSDKDCDFFINETDRKWAGDFLILKGIEENDLFVVLNPGGNWLPKRWPKEHFAELADRLSDGLGAKVVITGAPKDSELVQEVVKLSRTKPVNAAGQTTVKSLAAIMEKADLVVSSDSGPMHIAVSVKSKVVALFGPTSEAVTGPYGQGNYAVLKRDVGCRVPCYNFKCRDYKCMKAITVDEVFGKAKEMIENSRLKSQKTE